MLCTRPPAAPVCGRALPPGRFPDVGCPRVMSAGRRSRKAPPSVGHGVSGLFLWEKGRQRGEREGLCLRRPPSRDPAGGRIGG